MKLLTLLGVDIRVNPLLSLVFICFFLFGYIENIVISFLVVLLHEGAHGLVANLLGYEIESIEIFPFGGVAKIVEPIEINPPHELMIALAGPTLNMALAFVGYNGLNMSHITNEYLEFFVSANLVIGIFNLFPIVPLDGGRVIRAYLAHFIGFKKATRIVVILSKIMSVTLFLWGCYALQYNKLNGLVLLVAIFLFVAAHREYKMAIFIFMNEVTQKKQYLLSRGVVKVNYLVAIETTSIKDVLNEFVPRKYHIIAVLDQECNRVGTLTESQLLNGMMTHGLNTSLEKLLIQR